MNGGLKLVSLALVVVCLSFILKEIGFKGTKLMTAVGLCALYVSALVGFSSVWEELDSLGIEGLTEYAKDVIRIVGVGYVFGIGSDICAELGEGGLASALNVAGRVEIILIMLPFVKRIIALATEVMS